MTRNIARDHRRRLHDRRRHPITLTVMSCRTRRAPTRVVPKGPVLDFTALHDREKFTRG